MKRPPIVEIFTDGACSGNPGPGGWGAYLRYGRYEKEISGGEAHTTNNRMELMAVIAALETLKYPSSVEVTTDSQYVLKGVTEWVASWQKNGWRTSSKKSVLNADLWQRLVKVQEAHQVEWRWVKGHKGHPENERVDALARSRIPSHSDHDPVVFNVG